MRGVVQKIRTLSEHKVVSVAVKTLLIQQMIDFTRITVKQTVFNTTTC